MGSSSNNIRGGDPTTKYNSYSDRLKKIRMALSAEADKAVLKVIWDKFYKKLKKLEYEVTKDNKVGWQRFSKTKAIEITNFFFADIIGPKAVIRL